MFQSIVGALSDEIDYMIVLGLLLRGSERGNSGIESKNRSHDSEAKA